MGNLTEAFENYLERSSVPTVPAPKMELTIGSLVYAIVDGPDDAFHGRIFGLTAEWANVLWDDGYRGRHALSELALVFPEGV